MLSDLSYTGSLGGPTGTGLTLATSTLSSTAALSYHFALFPGGKGKLLVTAQGTSDILSSWLENRGEKTLGYFFHFSLFPKREKHMGSSLVPLVQRKVEAESTASASGLLGSTSHSALRRFLLLFL